VKEDYLLVRGIDRLNKIRPIYQSICHFGDDAIPSGGLFTKKFELYFKGSPLASSGLARECPHPLAAPSSPLGLRPRLFFARAIFARLRQALGLRQAN